MTLTSRYSRLLLLVVIAAPCLFSAPGAPAADPRTVQPDTLRIGLASGPTTVDPHYFDLGPNKALMFHLFDTLVMRDHHLNPHPGLATDWAMDDQGGWTFHLRPDVRFHDGRNLSAGDVIHSICRVLWIEGSPLDFKNYVRNIVEIDTPDLHTLHIQTRSPDPRLPRKLSLIAVIPAPDGPRPSLEDGRCALNEYQPSAAFDQGPAAVGTGPFRFAAFDRSSRTHLTRNPDYWGDRPVWREVVFTTFVDDGERVRRLLDGEVDLIETPPLKGIPRLQEEPAIHLVSSLSNRLIYLQVDHRREPTPGVAGTGGANPFRDDRVRRALTLAIDRSALAERVLNGFAQPTGQLSPPAGFGFNEAITAPEWDLQQAAALLAEAGFPNGFSVVFATPNDRYIRDENVAHAIRIMLAGLGVDVSVNAAPKAVFFPQLAHFDYSFFLVGWAADTGDVTAPLIALLTDPDMGGAANFGLHHNPDLNSLIQQADAESNEEARRGILNAATALVEETVAILPLYFEHSIWAMRKDYRFIPRLDQYILATDVIPESTR